MAELRQNTWTLDQWYDQDVAGNVDYTAPRLLYTVGYNDSGELGQGLSYGDKVSSPVQIPGTNWKYAASDDLTDGYVGAIKTNGEMWNWGRNENGELGINEGGSPTKQNSPYQVPGTTWAQVATCGRQCGMLATRTDGTLWFWGKNVQGTSGIPADSDNDKRSSPTQVGSDTTWPTEMHKLSSAAYCGGAIKTDGTLWTWGSQPSGQLGQNDTENRSSPVQVPGTTWKILKGGSYTFAAIKTDGTLWTWGRNERGQLGINDGGPGNNAHRSSPIQIPGTTWNWVDTGQRVTYATKTDGTLWAWGYNLYGQLGLNNTTSYSSPVQIPGTAWTGPLNAAATGFAPKTDGTMWGWGANTNGRLGIIKAPATNFDYYSSPVQIPGGYTFAVTGSPGLTAFMKVQ